MEGINALRAQFIGLEKNSILLCPKTSDDEIPLTQSKLGGRGILDDVASNCPICNTATSFVLQLFEAEFPSLFFPTGHDLLTIYRCRNSNCVGIYDDHMEDYTVIQYHQPKKHLISPSEENKRTDNSFPTCKFHPVNIQDLPSYEEDCYPDLQPITGIDEDELDELQTDHFAPRHGTKIGGYPSFIQSPWYPDCPTCQKPTEFIFQLASGEAIDNESDNEYPHWSDHGIMIGDLGNIYAYVCKACAPTEVLTYWDCY